MISTFLGSSEHFLNTIREIHVYSGTRSGEGRSVSAVAAEGPGGAWRLFRTGTVPSHWLGTSDCEDPAPGVWSAKALAAVVPPAPDRTHAFLPPPTQLVCKPDPSLLPRGWVWRPVLRVSVRRQECSLHRAQPSEPPFPRPFRNLPPGCQHGPPSPWGPRKTLRLPITRRGEDSALATSLRPAVPSGPAEEGVPSGQLCPPIFNKGKTHLG